MTFPVGNLPDYADVAQNFRPYKSVVFTGGGSDMDLTDPTVWSGQFATEFVCTTAGTFVAQLAGDATFRTYPPVNVGDVVYGLFVLIKGTSTSSGLVRR